MLTAYTILVYEEVSIMKSWLIYALLSAICAAFVSIFGKIGLSGMDSTAATAIRAAIMAIFLIGVAVVQGHISAVPSIMGQPKALVCIALSGIAGATSWLFYFFALKTGNVSQVAPIDKLSVVFSVLLAILLFGENVTFIHGIAIALIAIGGILLALF